MNGKNILVMFSGGRTSATMSYFIKKYWDYKNNIKFLYCNTGLENKKTLDFVDRCDKEFKLNLTWIEADVKSKGIGTGYKIVTFETASRRGEPFEDMVKKFGLPNKDFPHCTRELKIEPASKWEKDNFKGDVVRALGIRYDEPKRLSHGKSKIYPLATEWPMSKGDVIYWWRKRDFDLEVPEHLGNCETCWKKSDRKLWTIAKKYPEKFDFFNRLEEQYATTSNYDRKDKRVMFRNFRSTKDILSESRLDFNEFIEKVGVQPTLFVDECAEECGSFIK